MKTRLVFIFVISFCLSGCDNSPYVYTFGETSAERVAVMTDIIKKEDLSSWFDIGRRVY